MIGTEFIVSLMLPILGAGYAYEGYKWEHPKDPEPSVNYIYDPVYFKLGDEKSCGDEMNGPCHLPAHLPAQASSEHTPQSCSKCKA